jgi:acyl-CoA thioesterase-1
MKRRWLWLALVGFPAGLAAQTNNAAFQRAEETPGLPRVLLIGDSISIGYTLPLRALLRGEANVQRIPTNGGPTTNGLEHIEEWLGGEKWDVIHFNWGLHDLKIMEGGVHQVPVGDYERNLQTLVARLKRTGARLIWASTTPVPAGKLNPLRRPDDVPIFNAAAARVMSGNGIPTGDLFAFAMPRLAEIQLKENVHYTPKGYEALAGAVAANIRKALGGVSIRTDFEGGRLGRIERAGEAHFVCGVAGESDQDKRNRQANWYYFRVDGAAGREITVDLVDLPGEYNYQPNRGAVTGDTIPVYSEDNSRWKHFERVEYDAGTPRLRLRFTPPGGRFWIAHVPPYTNQDLARLLKELGADRNLRADVIGKSVEGRDLLLLTVTDPGVPDGSKKAIWLMIRQHSWETGSSWAGEGALRWALSADPKAVRMRREVTLKMFPLADPDGVARGGVRFNVHGYDLNRNWDAVDPKKMPEIAAARKAVLDWVDGGRRVDLFLTLHNTETAEYLEGPPDREGRHRALLQRWFSLLEETTTFEPTSPPRTAAISTTLGARGRMNVAQGLYYDRGLPAFVMEQKIAFNKRLGRLPAVGDRLEFGAGLVRTMWEAVTGGR